MIDFSDFLREGEAAEPLDDEHYILQRRDSYRFGSDAVALSKFAAEQVGSDAAVLDLCSGCGIIGILLAIETGACVTGIERDRTLFDMSVRSVALNGLTRVKFINADLREADGAELSNRFDVVVCNPPFYKADGKQNKIAPFANMELNGTFCDIAAFATRALKSGGKACFVHTCSRLDEVLGVCTENKLVPKLLVINKNCKTFLLKCVKCARAGLTVRVKEF